jgi:hypothetical protein
LDLEKKSRQDASATKRNASLVARRSTERDNHTRIAVWYTRGIRARQGEARKEEKHGAENKTQRHIERKEEKAYR